MPADPQLLLDIVCRQLERGLDLVRGRCLLSTDQRAADFFADGTQTLERVRQWRGSGLRDDVSVVVIPLPAPGSELPFSVQMPGGTLNLRTDGQWYWSDNTSLFQLPETLVKALGLPRVKTITVVADA